MTSRHYIVLTITKTSLNFLRWLIKYFRHSNSQSKLQSVLEYVAPQKAHIVSLVFCYSIFSWSELHHIDWEWYQEVFNENILQLTDSLVLVAEVNG